jgi:hypothetical protein
MSKSKPKGYGHNNWYDDYAHYDYIDRKSLNEHRRSKKIKNLIRAKNVNGLLEIDDDEDDWDNNRRNR